MTKTKNTRRALLISVLTMTLSFVMLIGTTFAWFTDSVSSGNNKIVAGNLDVEVTHTNNKVTNEALDKEGAKLFPVELWEPGVVSYETFTVKNVGSLAFDYKFNLNVADFNTVTVNGEEKSLKDVIKLGVIETPVGEMTREDLIAAVKAVEAKENSIEMNFTNFSDFGFEDSMKEANAEKTFTMVAYWEPTENDNDYNINGDKTVSKLNGDKNELYIDIVVNVVAKQRAYEEDSFNKDYDSNTVYPVITSQGLLDALEEAKTGDEIVMSNGKYELPAAYTISEGVTITGGPGVVLNVSGTGKDVTSPNPETGLTQGLLLKDNVTISNVTICGDVQNATGDQYTGYNALVKITGNNVTLDNVTINSDTNDSPIVITKTAANNTITIKNSKITAAFKAIHIVDGTQGTVIIDGCDIDAVYTFNVNTTSNLSLVVKNSSLKGWTSYGPSVTSVEFDNCEFSVGHGQNYIADYTDTVFRNCSFSGTMIGAYYQSKGTFTIELIDCSKDGTPITPANMKEKFDDSDIWNKCTCIVNQVTIDKD